MLKDDFAKVARAKTLIRKAITRRGTGLTVDNLFTEYPPYIDAIHIPVRTVNSTGLVDYCEDASSNFTVTTDSIRDYAFADYTQLKNLIITTDTLVELQGTHAFENTLIESGSGRIYVPANMVDTYKAATNWSRYADQIVANTSIPDEVTTNIIELEETVRGRTVEWFSSLTLEEIETDNRA